MFLAYLTGAPRCMRCFFLLLIRSCNGLKKTANKACVLSCISPAVIGAKTRKGRKNARGRSGRASVAHRPQGNGLSARLYSQKHRLHFSVVEKSARFLNSTQFRCGFSTPKYIKIGCSKRFLRLLSPIFATITELCSFWSESFQHYLVTFQTLSTVSNSYYLHCGNV